MKVLVFCSDILPYPGLPTTGGGLRCWQLIESLLQQGHEVIPSMPLFTFLAQRFADRIAPEVRELAWNHDNQDGLVERHAADAVLFTSTWIVDHLRREHPCLRIHDLDGPQLLEMHYKRERDFARNCAAKIERLSKADFVFCAGQRQRWYFFPFLLLAGFDVEDLNSVPVVPVARPEPLPVHEFPASQIEFVTGGGFYPWQDPWSALTRVAEAMSEPATAGARLRIFGTSHGVTGDDDRQFARLKADLERFDHVSFHDFLPHDQLLEVFRSSSVAVELHARNPERELAFTTRTVDYLWSGLPVLYNDYGELAEWIADYDAGWTVDPSDLDAVGRTVAGILADPAQITIKGGNAQRLVRERLTYSKTIGPLADFLRDPSRRAGCAPARILAAAEHDDLTSRAREYAGLLGSRAVRAARKLGNWRRRWRASSKS